MRKTSQRYSRSRHTNKYWKINQHTALVSNWGKVSPQELEQITGEPWDHCRMRAVYLGLPKCYAGGLKRGFKYRTG